NKPRMTGQTRRKCSADVEISRNEAAKTAPCSSQVRRLNTQPNVAGLRHRHKLESIACPPRPSAVTRQNFTFMFKSYASSCQCSLSWQLKRYKGFRVFGSTEPCRTRLRGWPRQAASTCRPRTSSTCSQECSLTSDLWTS